MIELHLDNTLVGLYGDTHFTINGQISCKSCKYAILRGSNGSGKTLTLATLAQYFGYPGFESLKSISYDNININTNEEHEISTVALVRQDPQANYSSTSVADELRLVYAETRHTDSEFRKRLGSLLTNELDSSIPYRDPRQLSSGEKQLVAVAAAVLVDADLLLLDEPLSHLSRKNAARVLKFLDAQTGNKPVIMSTHMASHARSSVGLRDTSIHNTSNNDRYITIEKLSSLNVVDGDLSNIGECIESVGIDIDSFNREKEWSDDFTELPTNTVRYIGSEGTSIEKDPISVEILYNNETLTRCDEIHIRKGINLLYGDNGAGKTLIARLLSHQISINPIWDIPFLGIGKALKAKGTNPMFDMSPSSNANDFVSLKWLSKKGECIYLPPDPTELVAERSVRQEIEQIVDPERVTERLKRLRDYGIQPDAMIRNLSFGQQKLVAFYLLPTNMMIPVLDEPFANLDVEYTKALSEVIMRRINSESWVAPVITTNRPLQTIRDLCI